MDTTTRAPNGHRHPEPERILLVDDNPDNLEIFGFLLGERYRVFPCGSAAQALTELETVRPALAVLDIRMRPLDGVQCLQAIRARPGFAGLPAVALTAFAREDDRQSFLAAGFQAVVTKPVLDQQQLIDVIDNLLTARTREPDRVWTAEEDAAAS